jgi:hypothetical protein
MVAACADDLPGTSLPASRLRQTAWPLWLRWVIFRKRFPLDDGKQHLLITFVADPDSKPIGLVTRMLCPAPLAFWSSFMSFHGFASIAEDFNMEDALGQGNLF